MTRDDPWLDFVRALLFLPDGHSTVADEVDWLHAFVFGVTATGAVVLMVFTIYCTIRWHSSDPRALTRRIVAPVWLELIYIVGLLGLFVVIWVLGFRVYTRLVTPPPGALDVYVTAKQWMWKFAYPDGRSTNDVLFVPAGRPVRLVMTSRDVIHSFFVPAFRTKFDLVPGRYRIGWFEAPEPGEWPLYCAEFCGLDHSHMRARVVALSARDWAQWDAASNELHALRADGSDMVARGRVVAAREGCLQCHTVDGTPHLAPTWVGLYGSVRVFEDGSSLVADESYLTRSMMDPLAQVVSGFEPIMPTFHGRLDSDDTAALVEYIRSLATRRDGDPLPKVRP